MRKLLNTLYVTNPDVYLSKDGDNIVAKIENHEVMRLPVINLEGIVCFNNIGASKYLMAMCAERNISLCFLTSNGRFLARVTGRTNGNVLLRRKQYRVADDKEEALIISKIMIRGKIHNSRKVVERFKRDHASSVEEVSRVESVSNALKVNMRQVLNTQTANELRGIEGDAAVNYFSIFDDMIVSQKSAFTFVGRNRRPPKDRTNCLLSFVYTLLAHEVQSALETVGLDPYVGFLHTDRPGRAGLALDMMEELRAYLVDRFVLSLINRKQVCAEDFIENGTDNIIMNDNCKKTVIAAWQKRKKDTMAHPFLKESVPIGLLPFIQAMLMARFLRGDLDNYPVFLIQ
ncbi:MAG: type I-C CRISPR-associated endonuclease Cas1 [Muribaculaceae bacterium]|nr:type I-C CRISPR-associated endonuclease Cas1 [Muribaculaceae bacterium]